MIEFQTGKQEEARERFKQVMEMDKKIGNNPGVDDFGKYDLENRLVFECLRREAKTLMENSGKNNP